MRLEKEVLYAQLKAMGAPLGGDTYFAAEQVEPLVVFAEALRLSRYDASLTRCFPVLLYKHRSFFQAYHQVREIAVLSGESRALGFFLELTASLSGDADLLRVAERHRAASSVDFREVEPFFLSRPMNSYARLAAEQNSPLVAKAWNFLLNEGMDSFEKLFRSFVPRVSHNAS